MKKLHFLLFLAMFVFGFQQVRATHVAAADIYYEYLSPLNYRIHLILYRDCKVNANGLPANAGLGGTATINVASVSCNQNFSMTVDTTGNNTKKIYGDLCPNIDNWCVNYTSIFPAYEEWHYSGNVTLPMACTDWVFTYNLCCRNNIIANMQTPGGQSMCIRAGVNNVARPVNSSAKLSIKPIPYVCVNQPKTYLNGPLDPDLDSLLFTGNTPLGTGNCGPTTFQGGGTVANPLGFAAPTGYIVDPNTGTAQFTPTVTGAYVLAFVCYDIDKNTGQTVGFVMRDVQINVLNCAAAPPSDPNGTQNYQVFNLQGATLISPNPIVMNVCPGVAMSFNVQGISNSGSNTILATSNNLSSCPGSVFTPTPVGGGNPVVGNFSWTPTAAQIGPHVLIVTFTDSTCTVAQPIVLKSYAVILINVQPGVDAGPDLTYCIGGDSVQFSASGPPGITQWGWTDINGNTNNIGLSSTTVQNPWAAPSVTTTYIVTAINPPPGLVCKTQDTVTVLAVPGIQVSAGSDFTICANDSIQLNATANPTQTNPTILWTPNATLSDSTALTPWASPLATTTYKLYFIDDFGCEYSDFTTVNVSGIRAVLNAQASDTAVCPGAPFDLYANAASMPCGLSVFPCNTAPQVYVVGTGNVQQNQFTPYFTSAQDAYKTQMIFTADELTQAGLRMGNIRSLSWQVTSKGSDTMRNVVISMGCTAATDFNGATGFISGLSVVLDTNKYNSVLGWNLHTLENPYYWDGVSNLVVQLCYNVTSNFNTQDVVSSSNVPANRFIHQNAATGVGCNLAATTPLLSSVRPNTRFSHCETSSFNYNWVPGSTLDNATDKNPTSSGIFNNTDFVVTVASTNNPNCVSLDTVKISVDNSNGVTASASPMILCEPGLITLSATPAGSVPVYMCGEENISCASPVVSYTLGTGTTNSTINTPFNGGAYSGSRTQFLLTPADLLGLGITKGKIESIALDVAAKNSTAGYALTIKMGCTPLQQLTDFVAPNNMKVVYSSNSYNTILGWNNFLLQNQFVWDGVSSLVVELCFFNGATLVGTDPVNYTATANAQYYSQSSNFGGCEIPLVQAPSAPITGLFRPNVQFALCDIPVKPWPYRWDPATFVFDSTAQTTTAYVNNTTTYHVYTTGGNQCEVTDSVTVTLSVHGLKVRPMDTTICEGDSYGPIATSYGNAPSYTLTWYDENWGTNELSCSSCLYPVITPTGSGIKKFHCVRSDSYGCSDTVTIQVNLNAKPNVVILNGDSLKIRYLDEVNLVATGAVRYSWTPVWGLSNPNIPQVVASPAEPTLYYVYGINALGCRAVDSIYIDIDYNDNLYVPNAFSPNTDGNNDVFRVANLTFQNVQEFKVMNRWGQEVFSANDNRGWNGTYKGKLQDGGTYFYQIRVAYPDGKARFFKGDVILVR
jgi:gliding motility-associated-like protein